MKLCFASHNVNKVREIKALAPVKYEVVGLNDLGYSKEIEETGQTLEENSALKAQVIFDTYEMAVFADDSGLLVKSLNGQPGVFSARYAGPEKSDEKNIDLLLSNLQGENDRTAKFVTVITFIDPNGNKQQFSGEVNGKIIEKRMGQNGFGYDPVFVPEGFDLTFAEMNADQKNTISHRSRAFSLFLNFLKEHS